MGPERRFKEIEMLGRRIALLILAQLLIGASARVIGASLSFGSQPSDPDVVQSLCRAATELRAILANKARPSAGICG